MSPRSKYPTRIPDNCVGLRGDKSTTKRIITVVFKPFFALIVLAFTPLSAAYVWLEGEDANPQQTTRHDWYGAIKIQRLSGGDMAHHWDQDKPGLLTYNFDVAKGGEYTLWLRANPTSTNIDYQVNDGPVLSVAQDVKKTVAVNIAADNQIDLRFLAWMDLGPVALKPGQNQLKVTFHSDNHHHGMLDVALFTNEPFTPNGALKPGEKPPVKDGWTAWDPAPDDFAESPIDLRYLNQERSGQDGRVLAKDGQFYFEKTDEPVRFWAINGLSTDLRGEDLERSIRRLAKYGVNLLRYHGKVFDESTGVFDDSKRVGILAQANEAEKHGVYLHLSIYFPLWFRPAADLSWLKGYDGKERAFVSVMSNPEFTKRYQEWWRELLLKPDENGRCLMDHPALMSVEIQNEDSFFFWTFKYGSIPDAQMTIIEADFYQWCIEKYGSLDKTYAAWNDLKMGRDLPSQQRLGIRAIAETYEKKTPRDSDTIRYLYEKQRGFYQEQVDFLRGLGFKGMITCGNWRTTDPQFLDPIENLSYFPGDFIDRHGSYFGSARNGQGASWSVREDHEFANRSALKFQPQKIGEGPFYSSPIWNIQYNYYPNVISETNFTRFNKYRGESQLYYAIYGSLQDLDGIMHFTLHNTDWATQQFQHVDPWTMMTPTQVGQFPAAALIYRKGLIQTGPLVADINLSEDSLFKFYGTPLAPRGNLDLLRQADLQKPDKDGAITPLIHYVGRTRTNILPKDRPDEVEVLTPYIDVEKQTIRSATGEILLNFGEGIATVNAPQAQIVMGDLSQEKQAVVAGEYALQSPMETIYTALVSLDGKPVATSSKMLLQIMTEEEPYGLELERVNEHFQKIKNLGHNPWLFRAPEGDVFLKRADASELKVTPLDMNGYPRADVAFIGAKRFPLRADTAYYLIEK